MHVTSSNPHSSIHDMSWIRLTISAILRVVWHGFDQNLFRQLDRIREMVALRHQTPVREWPLVVVEPHEELLVVREWPNGSMTAYMVPLSQPADSSRATKP